MKNLRDELIHATVGRIENINVNKPEGVNICDKVSRIGCPHEVVMKLIEYFENEKPKWLQCFLLHTERHVEANDTMLVFFSPLR